MDGRAALLGIVTGGLIGIAIALVSTANSLSTKATAEREFRAGQLAVIASCTKEKFVEIQTADGNSLQFVCSVSPPQILFTTPEQP